MRLNIPHWNVVWKYLKAALHSVWLLEESSGSIHFAFARWHWLFLCALVMKIKSLKCCINFGCAAGRCCHLDVNRALSSVALLTGLGQSKLYICLAYCLSYVLVIASYLLHRICVLAGHIARREERFSSSDHKPKDAHRDWWMMDNSICQTIALI